jgi:SAM-dependent methyltransferase
MTWTLEQGYDFYPRIEEEFNAALDVSLDPAGPDQLYDLVADLRLPTGSVVLDVGCGEGGHSVELARRFGFAVAGIDPVARHIEISRAAAGDLPVTFALGSAESIPADEASFDLVWCRDVLVHVRRLLSAYNEMARVLKRGGRAVVYQMFGTDLLEPREAEMLWRGAGVVAESAQPERTEAAIAAAGLRIDRVLEIGSEWGEWSQERTGGPGRKLLRLARLRRSADVYIGRYGPAAYDMLMSDCLWHVYAMIGKLTRRAYVLTRP